MTMHLHHPLEKLTEAFHTIATTEGDQRARLKAAKTELLAIIGHELPTEFEKLHADLLQKLTKFDAEGDEGSVDATLTRIKNKTAIAITEDIWNLWRSMLAAAAQDDA